MVAHWIVKLDRLPDEHLSRRFDRERLAAEITDRDAGPRGSFDAYLSCCRAVPLRPTFVPFAIDRPHVRTHRSPPMVRPWSFGESLLVLRASGSGFSLSSDGIA